MRLTCANRGVFPRYTSRKRCCMFWPQSPRSLWVEALSAMPSGTSGSSRSQREDSQGTAKHRPLQLDKKILLWTCHFKTCLSPARNERCCKKPSPSKSSLHVIQRTFTPAQGLHQPKALPKDTNPNKVTSDKEHSVAR